jgi:hypothetical protein
MVCAQEAGFPDINIICEKVAAEGETRFEDRYRLPIGISVNMTSFSAKLLTSAIYNPRNIMVFSQVGLPRASAVEKISILPGLY